MRVGKNFLVKRKFQSFYIEDSCVKKKEWRYIYYTKTQKATTTFWFQWYNENGEALDATVRAILNSY